MGEGISGEAGLAAAPYDQWLLLGPAEGSPRPSPRYKVRDSKNSTTSVSCFDPSMGLVFACQIVLVVLTKCLN
jgi:hypothetical protein